MTAINIIGLNAFHPDSAACLLKDGKLVAAAEEERFRRVKHWAGFPAEAIAYCLREGEIKLSDVDHIAINRNNRANLWHKVAYVAASRPSLGAVASRLRHRSKWAGVSEELARAFPGQNFSGTVENIEHHTAHLASAFFASSYPQAVAVSVDGFGDFASAAWGFGVDNRISLDGQVRFPHSLGVFYQAMTQYLGFPNYGDEYKLMGLAAYGRPLLVNEVRQLVKLKSDGSFALKLDFFRHQRQDAAHDWLNGEPTFIDLFSEQLELLLGPRRPKGAELTDRHRDLAAATQLVYEEAFFHLLQAMHAKYGGDALTLAGGCAYNSVANGKIAQRSLFKRSYLQSAAGDAGGAIGAAYVVWHRLGKPRAQPMEHAYWGPGFGEAEFERLIAQRQNDLTANECDVSLCRDQAKLVETVAKALVDGAVIGWFQGRMEWGPRALGNRSILADPRRDDVKEILNLKIKRRESFRPFAPSVLREHVADWFEQDDDVPFMMKVFPIRQEKRALVPAVTHVDGTGRLQTVHRETNPRYYALIEAFRELTGVPMIVNTSFNENEPVVCRPEEALDCFLRTKMDLLVLGDYLVVRRSGAAARATDQKVEADPI